MVLVTTDKVVIANGRPFANIKLGWIIKNQPENNVPVATRAKTQLGICLP